MAKIFESPDGGKTVRSREALVPLREVLLEERLRNKDRDVWLNILEESKKNPLLREQVERVIVYYRLMKND
jgi:hypothetical protein